MTTEPTRLLLGTGRTDTMKVKGRDGDTVGTVYEFLINKRSGIAMYAVLTVGGFLGMGKAYYPLPFSLLSFDPAKDEYVVTIDKRVLEGGPSWASNPPAFDQSYADRVSSYYGVANENLTA